ncbi:MAG: DUF3344 domain-containing protein [Halobacteriota archaeon]
MKRIALITAVGIILAGLLLLLCLCMPALAQAEEPDLAITAIKPYHYEWCAECDPPRARGSPWFNLKNYVGVTVENNRNATAESFEVTLYADDEPIGSKPVEGLSMDDAIDVTFEWEPEGEDPLSWEDSAEGAILSYTDTNKIYRLRAVVVEDGKEIAKNETKQEVAWNGYMADAPLEHYVHDTVKGGILYTTGDGQYRSGDSGDDGTKYGTSYSINYDLEIADGAKLARLFIYYTWSKPKREEPKAPKIGVTLETPSGNSKDLSMDKCYNDIKGNLPEPYDTYKYYAWGTYAYDITDYMKESGTYVVSLTNQNDGSDDDFATEFSFAPPAILLVYEDTTAPEREYWINEGADILIGGRRGDAGFLDLEECRNEAEFRGEHLDLEIEEAVLCVVSPWADDSEDDVIYFNGRELGRGLYRGYHHDWSSSEDIKGISMTIGAGEAQIGVAAIDVTRYLEDYDNEVVQGDDGDNMMPANAFLVITYEKEEEEVEEGGDGTAGSPGITAWGPVESFVNNTEGESRTFNISVNQTVDISWQINGTEVQINETAIEAVYTNTNAVAGTWNVSVIATNAITELHNLHTWIWNVTPVPTATPTPARNITTTPISTPTPLPTTTPKPTPALTPSSEEKEVVAAATAEEAAEAAAEETPGFELLTSLFILILVAYLIRRR